MVEFLILWCVFALAAALLLGRLLRRAASRRPIDSAPPADEAPVEARGGPFADFRGAVLALEQRGELVAKIATLHWVGGLEPAQIAEHMQVELATVERCLLVARQRPSSRAQSRDQGRMGVRGR